MQGKRCKNKYEEVKKKSQKEKSSLERVRTVDLQVMGLSLYQLSYEAFWLYHFDGDSGTLSVYDCCTVSHLVWHLGCFLGSADFSDYCSGRLAKLMNTVDEV